MTNEEVYKQYNGIFKLLLACTSRVYMHLYKELQKHYPNAMPYMSSRTKDVESVAFKVEQMEIAPRSLIEIYDLIGIRIVCLTESIANEVANLIPKLLNIVDTKDTKIRLGEDQFGYSSIHLIGKLTKDDSNKIRNSEDEEFIGLKFEIQVRTFAQHIFADLSHKYSYKSGKYIPGNIKRPLFRIAALSETIDEEIGRFQEERKNYINQYSPDQKEQISIDNLKLFLSNKFEIFRNIENKEDYDGLVRDLNHFGIKTIGDLDQLINKHYKEFLRLEERDLSQMIEIAGKDNAMIQKFIESKYIYSYVGTVRGILNQEFKSEWVKHKRNTIEPQMWKMINEMLK